MNVLAGQLEGLVVIEPRVFGDARGFFMESWNLHKYQDAGVRAPFVQDNISVSRRGALRGLHFQNPHPQGKLVSVLQGEVLDVVVDLRLRSASFGKWEAVQLSSENKRQFYIPPGFAHGFLVLSDTAMFHYKCTEFYSPKDELTLRWNDPDLGIRWPIENPIVSEKDAKGMLLKDVPRERLFDLP
jgi:dTDP-4-dehydrorhamnose 3,5-epimerase